MKIVDSIQKMFLLAVKKVMEINMKCSTKIAALIAVVGILAVCSVSKAAGKNPIFMAEIGSCAWTESTQGNTMVYKYLPNKLIVEANGKPWMSMPIVKIIDKKRQLIVKTNGKYIPVWWETPVGDTIMVSQMTGVAKTTLKAAENTPKPKELMPLTKQK
jgi:hypothetical protein